MTYSHFMPWMTRYLRRGDRTYSGRSRFVRAVSTAPRWAFFTIRRLFRFAFSLIRRTFRFAWRLSFGLVFRLLRRSYSVARERIESRQKTNRTVRRLARRLRLNSEQTMYLGELYSELETLLETMSKNRIARKAELLALLAEPTLNQKQAMAIWQQKTRAMDEAAAEIIMALAQFTDSLEDDQRERMLAVVDGWLERRWFKSR